MSGSPPTPAPAILACAGAPVSPPRPRNASLKAPRLMAIEIPLSQEFSAAADDRQVDEFRSRAVGGRIAHVEAAEVDVLHLFQRRDVAVARQVAARAPEARQLHRGAG